MTPTEYIQLAVNTEAIKTPESIRDEYGMRLLHASLGMTTESAELADMLKRTFFYGTSLDRINALEEIGDTMWYIAIAADALDCSLERIMRANIAKLQFRYPSQFHEVMAVARDLPTERRILEQVLVGGE